MMSTCSSATKTLKPYKTVQVAAVASTPVDLAKTRLMNAGDGRAMYRGMFHCLTSTARNEGIFALYKGFFPNWFRLAPWTLMFFLSYERIRFGLSTFSLSKVPGQHNKHDSFFCQVRWMRQCSNPDGSGPVLLTCAILYHNLYQLLYIPK